MIACIDCPSPAPSLAKPQAGPFQDYVLKGNANHPEAASCLEEVKIDSVFVKVIFGHCQKLSHLRAWGDREAASLNYISKPARQQQAILAGASLFWALPEPHP